MLQEIFWLLFQQFLSPLLSVVGALLQEYLLFRSAPPFLLGIAMRIGVALSSGYCCGLLIVEMRPARRETQVWMWILPSLILGYDVARSIRRGLGFNRVLPWLFGLGDDGGIVFFVITVPVLGAIGSSIAAWRSR